MASKQEQLSIIVTAKDRLSKTFNTMTGKVNRFITGPIARLGAALAGTAAFARGTRDAIAFGDAMGTVATLTDLSKDQMAALSGEVLDLATAFGSSELDLAKAQYQAISSGVTDATRSIEFLTVAQKLALGAVGTTTEAVDVLSNALNAYSKETEEAARFADILQASVKAGKTTLGELAGGLSTSIPLAASLRVQFEELGAAVAAITAGGGGTTSEASTQIAALLRALLNNGEAVNELFQQELGRTFDDTTIQVEGLAGVIDMLSEATNGSQTALIELLGRAEAMNAVINLSGDKAGIFAEKLADISEAAVQAGDDVEEAFARRMDTSSRRITGALNAIRIGFLELSETLLEDLLFISDELGSTEDRFEALRDGVKNLEPVLKATTLAFLTVAQGVIAIQTAVNGFLFTVAAVRRELGLLGDDAEHAVQQAGFAAADAEERLRAIGEVVNGLAGDLFGAGQGSSDLRVNLDAAGDAAESASQSLGSVSETLVEGAEAAEKFNEEVEQLGTFMDGVRDTLSLAETELHEYNQGVEVASGLIQGFGSSAENSLFQVFSGTLKAKEGFKSFAASVLQDVQRVISRLLSMQLVMQAVGFIGNVFSLGGGSTTSSPVAVNPSGPGAATGAGPFAPGTEFTNGLLPSTSAAPSTNSAGVGGGGSGSNLTLQMTFLDTAGAADWLGRVGPMLKRYLQGELVSDMEFRQAVSGA